MTTMLYTKDSISSLLNQSSLPIETTYKNSLLRYETTAYPKISSDIHLAAAFAIWLHRLTNEEEFQLYLQINGKLAVATMQFSVNTTSEVVYNIIEQAFSTPISELPNEITYFFSNVSPSPLAVIQLITTASTFIIEGLEANINAKNMSRYMQYYTKILQFSLIEAHRSVLDFEILTEEETQQWANINSRTVDATIHQTMHAAFKATAMKNPHKIALQNETTAVSFLEIDQQSDAIAQFLLEHNSQIGDYVSVYMSRSIHAIIAMLGVMKAGAIYVPLSPDNPDERNEYILNDTKSKIVIADTSTLNQAMRFSPQYTEIIEFKSIPQKELTASCDVKPSDLAYIIYTSGSTGRPKGVKIPHKSIATFALGEREVYDFKEDSILTQFYTLTFDASMLELCPMLFFGNTLYMLSKEERLDIALFAEAIAKNKIDYVMMVPVSALKQFALFATETDIEKMQRLQCFGVGGEALPAEIARLFQKTFGLIPLINVYGPTECSVLTTTYKIDTLLPNDLMNIPIGSPLPNYRVHVLNQAMQYCPINVPGELYIETEALADGYLNLPDKTNAVFVKTPLSDALMYRSGDVVRLLENNQLEFVGRSDSQVKIRGFRVELGEIEEQLLAVEHIVDGAIVTKMVQNEKTIIAYYKNEQHYNLTPNDLLHALQKQLPDYMLPSYCVELHEFPLLPSGKINRNALSNLEIIPVENVNTSSKKMPQNETEAIILQAWQTALNAQYIGIDEDFFEIGGHSLKVLAILSTLKKHYPILTINDFFKHRTIEQLATYVTTTTVDEPVQTMTKTVNIQLIEHPKQLYSPIDFQATETAYFFLTGATGYLGAHILLNLLQSPIEKVAVLVRSKTPVDGFARLIKVLKRYDQHDLLLSEQYTNKIKVISGDFTQENLAACPNDLVFLKEHVDAILHCGADVRHFGDEEHFKKTNIDSTAHLIEFAQQCKNARFHYVSTLGIQEDLASEGNWDAFLATDSILDAPAVSSLYTNSKLESEKLLQQAHAAGLPVTIYRPGNISCQSTTGIFQNNIDANAVYRMFKSFILLKKAPDVDFMMDFTMVDYASFIITELALSTQTIGSVYNICNTTLISFKDVLDFFRSFGYIIELVTEEEFKRFVYDETPKNPEGVSLAMASMEGDGAKNSDLLYACPNTKQFMEQQQLIAPKPDESFFEKMIRHAIDTQYFPAINE